jgi:hypothetical protein
MARQQALAPLDPQHPAVADPPAFRDPQRAASHELGIKLLREILEFQQRLAGIDAAAASDRPHLANAWRHSIRIRREMLRDLSEPSD